MNNKYTKWNKILKEEKIPSGTKWIPATFLKWLKWIPATFQWATPHLWKINCLILKKYIYCCDIICRYVIDLWITDILWIHWQVGLFNTDVGSRKNMIIFKLMRKIFTKNALNIANKCHASLYISKWLENVY